MLRRRHHTHPHTNHHQYRNFRAPTQMRPNTLLAQHTLGPHCGVSAVIVVTLAVPFLVGQFSTSAASPRSWALSCPIPPAYNTSCCTYRHAEWSHQDGGILLTSARGRFSSHAVRCTLLTLPTYQYLHHHQLHRILVAVFSNPTHLPHYTSNLPLFQ